MTELLTALTRTLHAQPTLAVFGAFLWGVASILLSPCHLASVPLIVAYTGRSTSLSSKRAAALSVMFALGILLTILVIGGFSVIAGRMVGALGSVTNYLVAVLLFVVGLELLGVWPFQWSGLPRPQTTRRGLAGAFLFGLAFGTALGPCTFAFLGPVIGATVQAATAQPALAALLVFAYGCGHCAVLALAGSLGPVAARYTVWSEGPVGLFRAACGALVMIGGLYLIYSAP